MAQSAVAKAPGPAKTQLAVSRRTIEAAEFVPAPLEDVLTREQERIGREVVRRNAAIEATAFTTAYGLQAAGAIFDCASFVYGKATQGIIGRREAEPSFVRTYTDPFNDGLVADMGMHMRAIANFGTEQIAHVVAQSYDLPERKRRWRLGER